MEKGWWEVDMLALDGSWCIPAPHGVFAARSLKAFGALLGFKFMSRNDPTSPFLGTSASMEVFGCVEVINSLFEAVSYCSSW